MMHYDHHISAFFFLRIQALDLHTQSIQKQIIEYDITRKFYILKRTRLSKLLARNPVSCKINHLLISFLIPKQAQLNAYKRVFVD